MAKQSLPESILEILMRPEACVAPLAARGLLSALLVSLWRMRSAVFRFGSRVPETREVCLALTCSETEWETGVENLIGRGILTREPDGAISCPLLAGAFRSAEARRANGLAGGRPRKGETAAQALERRQGRLMMPLAGGAETRTKPDAIPQAKLKPEDKLQLKALTEEVEKAACVAGEFAADDIRQVGGWLEAGADEALILRVVAAKAEQRSPEAAAIRGLRWFDGAVRDALATAAPVADAEFDWPAHARAVEAWQMAGCIGPAPAVAAFRRERA